MNNSNYIEIGYIAKAHGLHGEVKAVFDVYDISEYENRKELFIAKKDESVKAVQLKQFHVQSDKQALLRFADVRYRDQAEALKGYTLYIPQEDLPTLPEGHYYYFEIIGFRIIDNQLGELGTVKDIYDGPADDILVMEYKDKEVLIPMNDTFVGTADLEEKILHTSLPEGLLEAYLE